MLYTIILDEGIVIRNADQKIVSPCQSVSDPAFIEYINWVNNGNSPIIFNTRSLSEEPITDE